MFSDMMLCEELFHTPTGVAFADFSHRAIRARSLSVKTGHRFQVLPQNSHPLNRAALNWLKEAKEPHETAARDAKIGALKISDDEKSLLKNDSETKQAKELARKFSKELKI